MPSPSRNRARERRSRSLAAALVVTAALLLAGKGTLAQPVNSGDTEAEQLQIYGAAMPMLATAREHIEVSDYARAEKILAGLVTGLPEWSEAHLLLAKSRYAQGRFAAALTAIEKAERTFDATAAVMVKVRDARKAQLTSQKDAQLTIVGANASAAAADAAKQTITMVDRELAALDAANTTAMPAEYPFFHGNILLRLGRPAEAVDQYRASLAIDPAYGPAANNLASVYYEAKRYQDARDVIETLEAHGQSVNPELKRRVLEALGTT